jgi:hypothetical protein
MAAEGAPFQVGYSLKQLLKCPWLCNTNSNNLVSSFYVFFSHAVNMNAMYFLFISGWWSGFFWMDTSHSNSQRMP